MKSLNENWFAITLVAVIFGLLGFLIGKTSGKHHQDKNLHKVFMKDLKGENAFIWKSDMVEFPDNINVDSIIKGIDIKIDTSSIKGKKSIKVQVFKQKKLIYLLYISLN